MSSWVFGVGVACILLGVGLLVGTLYWVTKADTTEKTVVAVTGCLGTFLTHFVAVIFLKMHAVANKSFGGFYDRLADAQRLFLANIMASHVQPPALMSKALAGLASNVAGAASRSPTKADGAKGKADKGSNGKSASPPAG
jgi:hypothetical protein